EDTVGAVVSIVSDWLPLLAVFPTRSDCVATSVYVPCVDSALVSVALQAPDEHVAVPLSLAVPLTDQPTVVLSPDAVPHAPPIVVTFWFVEYGKPTALPLTFVNDTTGAVLSIVTDSLPLLPVLPAKSDCVATSV